MLISNLLFFYLLIDSFCFRIRAAIKLTIPNRKELINKLVSKRSSEEIDRYADEVIQSCNTIDRTTQELFEAHQMTKLS
jgi:hypothetical protein